MDSMTKGLMGAMHPQNFWARTAPDDRQLFECGVKQGLCRQAWFHDSEFTGNWTYVKPALHHDKHCVCSENTSLVADTFVTLYFPVIALAD